MSYGGQYPPAASQLTYPATVSLGERPRTSGEGVSEAAWGLPRSYMAPPSHAVGASSMHATHTSASDRDEYSNYTRSRVPSDASYASRSYAAAVSGRPAPFPSAQSSVPLYGGTGNGREARDYLAQPLPGPRPPPPPPVTGTSQQVFKRPEFSMAAASRNPLTRTKGPGFPNGSLAPDPPAYVSVSAAAPGRPAYAAASVQAPAPSAPAGPHQWPPSLRAYVERSFAATSPHQRPQLQLVLKQVIAQAQARGDLWTRPWESLPLPDLTRGVDGAAAAVALAVAEEGGVWRAPASSGYGILPPPFPSPPPPPPLPPLPPEEEATQGAATRAHQAAAAIAARLTQGMAPQHPRGAPFSAPAFPSLPARGSGANQAPLGAPRAWQPPLPPEDAPPPQLDGRREKWGAAKRARWEAETPYDKPAGRSVRAGWAAEEEEEEPRGGKKAKARKKKKEASGRSAASERATPAAALMASSRSRRAAGGEILDQGMAEETWSARAIRGTCQRLAKSYFRLTGAPDPASVRPPEVLERALAELVAPVARGEVGYFHALDQFKAMRQDCTVQHLRGTLPLKVYEAHARAALEYGDVPEFNQCQARLWALYGALLAEEGTGGGGEKAGGSRGLGTSGEDRDAEQYSWRASRAEFLAYRILYQSVHTRIGETYQLQATLASLTPEDLRHPAVSHALRARRALAQGDVAALMRAYARAPALGRAVLDLAVPRLRLHALEAGVKAYQPWWPLHSVASMLGFVACGEGGAVLPGAGSGVLPGCSAAVFRGKCAPAPAEREGLQACAEWVETCGASVDRPEGAGLEGAAVDCRRAATAALALPPVVAVAHGDANLDIGDFLKALA